MEGMRAFGGATVTYADGVIDIVLTGDASVRRWHGEGVDHLLPNLADPATRGCLLQLVREVLDNPRFYVDCAVRDGVEVWHGRMDGRRVCTGPTEPAAIVAALEVAPNV